MKNEQILEYFDGRGTVDFTLRGRDILQSDRIEAIAFELGYRLHERDIVTRGQWRLTYLRDDSPDVRRRVQVTLDRLRADGPLLAQAWPSAGTAGVPGRRITPMEVASVRQSMTTYEAQGARGLVIFSALLSSGCLGLAWVARDFPGRVLALVALAALLAVVAALTPRWMRGWYEHNRQKVDRFGRQRAQQWGPPPPPPSPPPLHGNRQDGPKGNDR